MQTNAIAKIIQQSLVQLSNCQQLLLKFRDASVVREVSSIKF